MDNQRFRKFFCLITCDFETLKSYLNRKSILNYGYVLHKGFIFDDDSVVKSYVELFVEYSYRRKEITVLHELNDFFNDLCQVVACNG